MLFYKISCTFVYVYSVTMLFGIGLILRSLQYAPYALHYAAILFLLCQILLNHSKLRLMH